MEQKNINLSEYTPKPGDILLEKNNGSFGALMSFFTRPFKIDPKFQHARVICDDINFVIEDGEIFGKNGKTSLCIGINEFPKDLTRYEVWRPLCDGSINLKAIEYIKTRIGESYSISSLILIYLRKFVGLHVPDAPGCFCSELISWAWKSAGYDLNDELEDWDTAPWELANSNKLTRVY